MKTFLLIIIPFVLCGQRLDIKDINGVSYLIQTDTSSLNVITITKTPLSAVASQMDAKIADIQSKLDYLSTQKANINAQIKEYNLQLKQAQDLRAQVSPVPVRTKSKRKK